MSFLLAQLSDIHIIGSTYEGELYVDNNDRLRMAVDRLRAESVPPDAVLITGDLTDLGTEEEMRIVLDLLAPLDVPVLAVPGNHDIRSTFRSSFDLPWAADEHVSWVVDFDGFTLVGLDSLVVDQTNEYGEVHHSGLFDEQRATWLDEVLGGTADRPTAIAMHHPPFLTGIGWMDETGLRNRERFAEVVGRHPHVTRIFSGHLHRAITTMVGGAVASTGISTVHHVELNLDPTGPKQVICDPPGYHLHAFDGRHWVTHTRHFDVGVEVINPSWANH